jgi:uncharacterized protein YegL
MAKKALEAILGNGDTSELVDKKVDVLNQSKRIPAAVLIDTSGSMHGYEALLKKSVEQLYDEILSDRDAGNSTELAVMAYNNDVEILEKLREIKKQKSKGRDLKFECKGVTLTGLALKTAIHQLESRKKAYAESTHITKYYAPLLFILSDGCPYCDNPKVAAQDKAALAESIKYIRQEVSTNNLVVIAVEIGNDCDHKLLQSLTGLDDDKHVIKIDHASELSHFFKLTSSVIISSSKFGTTRLNDMSIKDMK